VQDIFASMRVGDMLDGMSVPARSPTSLCSIL
jgi:hypothetical protein